MFRDIEKKREAKFKISLNVSGGVKALTLKSDMLASFGKSHAHTQNIQTPPFLPFFIKLFIQTDSLSVAHSFLPSFFSDICHCVSICLKKIQLQLLLLWPWRWWCQKQEMKVAWPAGALGKTCRVNLFDFQVRPGRGGVCWVNAAPLNSTFNLGTGCSCWSTPYVSDEDSLLPPRGKRWLYMIGLGLLTKALGQF